MCHGGEHFSSTNVKLSGTSEEISKFMLPEFFHLNTLFLIIDFRGIMSD